MSNVQELSRSRVDRFLGLFANEDMVDYGTDGVGRYAPNVPKALDTLSRDRGGFLLFLAEEGIDDMSHENNAHGVIDAGKALEATVAEVLRFVKTHPDTLVIINGDHETGGLTIEDGPSPISGSPLRFSADWTTHDHTRRHLAHRHRPRVGPAGGDDRQHRGLSRDHGGLRLGTRAGDRGDIRPNG